MVEYAVECINLTKRFNSFTAVNSISFKVRRGNIFGMLGPNGSGKSTTIRMLCGLMDPTSGTALVSGRDIRTDTDYIKAHIGYMSQKFSLYTDLTAGENLRFYAGIYKVPREVQPRRIEEIAELTGIRGRENTLTSDLPTGYRQRLALGCAIIHRPEIIFLDEPTSGADPVSRRRFWDLIYDVTSAGATVIVTTHYMDEAERCDELLLLSGGSIIASGSPAELKLETIRGTILSIETDQPTKVMEIAEGLKGVKDVALYGRSVHVSTSDPDATSRTAADELARKGIRVSEIREVTPTLEDVFVSLIGSLETEGEQA
jgi:ABC-2 type transport system ATP-binding protein